MCSRSIVTTIDIAAPVERVWRIFSDFAHYPQWGRFILGIEGEARPGTPLPGGGTRFHHGEVFGGLLVPLLWNRLDTKTRAGFEEFNTALRGRAEHTV